MKIFVAHLVGALCWSLAAGVEQGFGVIFPDAQVVDLCLGRPDGYFVNDLSACEAYFSCKDGVGVPLKCPNGLHFDEVAQKCNYPDQVSCVSCPPEGIHTQPDLFNCTRFVLCYGGVQIPMECAPGLRFDPSTGQCGLAADVPCPIRCPPGIQAPEDILYFPSEVDCADYVICYNGSVVEFRCPANTHFNRETNQCDTVESANCPLATTTTTSATTTTTEATTTTTSPPPLIRRNRRALRNKEHEVECPSEGVVFVPHATDCASYFICNEGEAIPRRCAASLVFDLMSNNCNFPAQSVCVTDHKQTEIQPGGGNVPKKPEFGPTAATPSLTAATPMGPAPIRWH